MTACQTTPTETATQNNIATPTPHSSRQRSTPASARTWMTRLHRPVQERPRHRPQRRLAAASLHVITVLIQQAADAEGRDPRQVWRDITLAYAQVTDHAVTADDWQSDIRSWANLAAKTPRRLQPPTTPNTYKPPPRRLACPTSSASNRTTSCPWHGLGPQPPESARRLLRGARRHQVAVTAARIDLVADPSKTLPATCTLSPTASSSSRTSSPSTYRLAPTRSPSPSGSACPSTPPPPNATPKRAGCAPAASPTTADRRPAPHDPQQRLRGRPTRHRDIVREPAEEVRQLELMRLDEMHAAALAVLEARHFVVDPR